MSAIADAELLRRLQRVTDAALSHLELDDLLEALLERTRDVLPVDTCVFLLLDDSNELVPRATLGLDEESERGLRTAVGPGFADRIATERRPIVIDDVGRADSVNEALRDAGLRSLLGVPLLAEGRVIGVLHVGTFEPRIFDDTDVELLQLVADRAAIAIEHARLFESERSAHRRLEQVQAVTDVALTHLELDALLAELLGRIRDALSADTCAFLLLDEETNELVARAALGIEEEVEQGVRIPLGKGFAGRIAATRRPVVLDDVDLADIFNPILREKGIKSLLGAPLISRDSVVGVVHVGTLRRRLFTPADVDLLQLVANRVGLAIDKARLHEETVLLDQMKLNFVAIASHELRTPAAAVYGAAMTLQGRGDALPQETRALLEQTLYEQADRLRRLTEQLLDLSRLDAKAIPVAPRKLDIETVLNDVVDGVGANASVTIEIPEPIEALVDELVVERVVTNLLINALNHGRPPIVVRAEQTRRSLRIAVSDAGPGVDAELVPRLFERFERGVDGNGSGLGLAIAKAYALAHGGDLVYDAQGPGARFTLTVPAREP